MLLTYSLENYRGFRGRTEFSLQRSSVSEAGFVHRKYVKARKSPIEAVAIACLFGGNGSGKSQFLQSLSDIRTIVLGLRGPRRLGVDESDSPVDLVDATKASLEIVLDDEIIQYAIEFDNFRVLREEIYVKSTQRPGLLYRVERGKLTLGSELKAIVSDGIAIAGDGSLLRYFAQLGSPTSSKLTEWFRSNFRYANETNRAQRWALTATMLRQPQYFEPMRSLLLEADLGVDDFFIDHLDERALERISLFAEVWRGVDVLGAFDLIDLREPADIGIRLLHGKERLNEASINLDEESSGTKVWFGAIGIILDTLVRGSVLLADELDTSMHPNLVRLIISIFQSPISNPKCAQLITNSQDVSLLETTANSRILGRDQVWFCNRNEDGSLKVEPLSRYSPRRSEAIQKRYLEGDYGGVPKRFDLGLIETLGDSVASIVSPKG